MQKYTLSEKVIRFNFCFTSTRTNKTSFGRFFHFMYSFDALIEMRSLSRLSAKNRLILKIGFFVIIQNKIRVQIITFVNVSLCLLLHIVAKEKKCRETRQMLLDLYLYNSSSLFLYLSSTPPSSFPLRQCLF